MDAQKLGKGHLPRSLFIDIDGTLLKHQGTLSKMVTGAATALPGTVDVLDRLMKGGHLIILTTGRPESTRGATETQLRQCGVVYHQLVMGVGHGPRILINDEDPDSPGATAVGATVRRDDGILGLCIATGRLE